MPKLSVIVPHKLPPEEACTRLKTLIHEVKSQHADKIRDVHEEWDGRVGKFRFTASGFAVAGTLTVNESQVEIAGSLPFVATLYKSKIEAAIRERATTLLA